MPGTRGNLDQTKRRESNPDIFLDGKRQTIEETQAGVDNLRQSTIDSSLSTADMKSDLIVERTGLKYEKDIHSFVGFLTVVDNILEEIEDTKKGISKKGLSKAGKKTMNEAKAKLKQYEKQLNGKRNTLLKQNKNGKAEIYENDIVSLRNLWQQVDQVRKDIGMGQWGKFSNTAGYLYNSPEIARKSNKRQTKVWEFNQNFQGNLSEGAILNIFNGDVQKANNFLRRIAQGEYTQTDYELFKTNSSELIPYFQKYGINIPTQPVQSSGRIEGVSKTTHKSVDYSNMDWGDTFKQGGIAGVLDKLLSNCSNMTSGQRDTRKTLGVLSIIGGVIYGQYKFYTNKNIGLGTKIGLTILPIFGSQFLTGEDPLTLFKKLMVGGLSMNELKNKFGNAVGGLSSSGYESAEATVPAMQSMMIFNSGTTAGNIQQMTRTFRADNKNRRNFYKQSCDKIQREGGTSATESFQAFFSEDFDEKKWENWLASFGITGSTNSTETVHNLAENSNTNRVILEKFLSDSKLSITTNPAKKTEVDAYIQGKNEKNELIEINDLKGHTDRFTPVTTQANPDFQNPDKQISQNIEVTKDSLKISVEKGLSKLFKHFRSIYGNGIKYIKVTERHIPNYSPGITNDILSKLIKKNGNSVSIDISDNNIKGVYDNAVEKLANNQNILMSVAGTSKEIRNHKRDKIKAFKQNGKINEYNEWKNNLTDIVKILFEDIAKDLKSKGGDIKICRNGQIFNNISDALSSIQIFS